VQHYHLLLENILIQFPIAFGVGTFTAHEGQLDKADFKNILNEMGVN